MTTEVRTGSLAEVRHPRSMPAPAIVVDGVAKTFARPQFREHTLKERVLHPLRRRQLETFDALRDVSFEVADGEFFGIVGRNGSGKSTLLKLMAGIYKATAGDIWIRGRLSTFIELGVGFNPDLAARDNVQLNAMMLGLNQREAEARYDQIIDFAELREFEDLKLKNYSSGMHVRLAFSVMIQVDADVLLIDEVLAVGDAAFQQKCYDEFNRLRDDAKTIVLVTHDMGAVRRFCDRAMLMERGNVIDVGDPERIGSEYLDVNFAVQRAEAEPEVEPEEIVEEVVEDPDRHGDGRAEIVDLRFEDASGEPLGEMVPHGTEVTMTATVRFRSAMQHPVFTFAVDTWDRHLAFVASSAWREERTGEFAAGDVATVVVRFTNRFANGRYYVTPQVAARGGDLQVADRRDRWRTFVSVTTAHTGGIVDLDFDLDVLSSPAAARR
jgi:ABC-type polysaccharide/polyol phosphate transport system ATPase subunit